MRLVVSSDGGRNLYDAVECVMDGFAWLPSLIFCTGNVLTRAVCLFVLYLPLAALGVHTPPPPAPLEGDPGKPREEPAERTGRK